MYGLEYSETMVQVATQLNKTFIEQGRVQIKQGNIEKIPYGDSVFNKIFTVNTIYFWSSPVLVLREIKRVLKPGGRLVITFRSKDIMSERASNDSDFELYTPAAEELKKMLKETGYDSLLLCNGRETRSK
ncbi:class I SAM-dependent methyltransferase [Cytobacillus firmus]|uniref:class I SAM-dependent methyltransferase n=1 Tax=Cytobacillus firmus TaxID=1399 RepID=UPI0022282999|nr:class I SAM-dependent methyltransferase [Cytobacillus firmus]